MRNAQNYILIRKLCIFFVKQWISPENFLKYLYCSLQWIWGRWTQHILIKWWAKVWAKFELPVLKISKVERSKDGIHLLRNPLSIHRKILKIFQRFSCKLSLSPPLDPWKTNYWIVQQRNIVAYHPPPSKN